MAKTIQAIRGINDILPEETILWQHVEEITRQTLESYGYREIRLPLVEKTELFSRSIGEVTDIVEKEMYTFADRNGESITLRPEGTAGCARAGIEHGLFRNQTQRLWYQGQMFRYERPQQGRYRQFHQIGVEVYGLAGPDIDAEMLLMLARLWQKLGLNNDLELQINSLGNVAARAVYRQQLVAYFKSHEAQLDEDSQRRLHTNPLRILDSKTPEMQDLIENAPQLLEYLDTDSQTHFTHLKSFLETADLAYRVNPRLVRGLDYYNHTVFEWVTQRLGAQGTVCAGGRYDTLVEQLGGRATPAVGFALGMERLIALLAQNPAKIRSNKPDAYLLMVGEAAQRQGLRLAEHLREQIPSLRLFTHCGGGSFKTQFKHADKSGAIIALIVGEDEAKQQQVAVKFLREDKPQLLVSQNEAAASLEKILNGFHVN